MPNRLLRDGALHSKALNSISLGAEVLFYRLLMCADDFGLAEVDPFTIKSRCFGVRIEATPEVIAGWLRELAHHQLLRPYEADGRSLAAVNKWEQRRNAKHPKYPLPPWGTEHVLGGYVARQARTESHRDVTPSHPIATATPPGNGQLALPLVDGTEWPVPPEFLAQLDPLYPLVDVPATVIVMRGWLIGNPARRKTARGIKRFVTGWLAKEQERYASEKT